MRVVFHGENAASFSNGFADMMGAGVTISILPDNIEAAADRATFEAAETIIGTAFSAAQPAPAGLKLYHVPGAGYDAVDLAAVPPAAIVCNCFGHETPIAEYVMAVLLQRVIPLTDADRCLRQGEWAYWAGAPERAHDELSGSTLGILGFGHIGKAVAERARVFGMRVHVANRSAVQGHALIDQAFTLTDLAAFWASADAFVVTVPLADDTKSLVSQDAFSRMRPHAWLINVARGPVVDEHALFDALHTKRIGGAVIDTWYQYPGPGSLHRQPSTLPFHTLSNIVMTPHMSGWTTGTIRRRQQTIADNIRRVMQGEPCENVVRGPVAPS